MKLIVESIEGKITKKKMRTNEIKNELQVVKKN